MKRNGLPRIPTAPGAILLAGSMLRDRVAEIITARMKQPFPDPSGPVSMGMQVSCNGPAEQVDAAAVRARVEQVRWDIVKELRSRGIDPSSGDFTVDGGQGGHTPDGTPACAFNLTWTPRTPTLAT